MRAQAAAALAALVLVTLPGCCPAPAKGPAQLSARSCREAWGGRADALGPDRRSCHKRWTVLLYMEADNDLLPYAHLNLYEMEAAFPDGRKGAASTVDTDVLVRLDTPGPAGLRRLHMIQTDQPYDPGLSRELLARPSESFLRSPVVQVDPEREGWNPAADLEDFLTWGVSEYPAEHYLVVVWGHGEGWGLAQRQVPPPAPAGNPFTGLTGGIAFDWTQRTYLGIPVLHQVLRRVVDGPLGGRPIDVYLSDACLMQSLEVSTELADVARFVAGSIQVEGYLGMSYRDLLPHLSAAPSAHPGCAGQPDEEACSAAALLPEVYRASLGEELRASLEKDAALHFTLSAVRTGTLRSDLLPALAQLGGALAGYLDADPLHAGELIDVLGDRESPSFLGSSRDVGVFLDALEGRARRHPESVAAAKLLGAIHVAQDALRRTLVGSAHGSDYARYPAFAAYSVWLPISADDYRTNAARYAPSAFFQNGRSAATLGPWQGWLDRLYGH